MVPPRASNGSPTQGRCRAAIRRPPVAGGDRHDQTAAGPDVRLLPEWQGLVRRTISRLRKPSPLFRASALPPATCARCTFLRARGALIRRQLQRRLVGAIPQRREHASLPFLMNRAGAPSPRAGSTSSRRMSAGPRWDHPRTRGEHYGSGRWYSSKIGPPPHARGARMRSQVLLLRDRNHPRTRGEHDIDPAKRGLRSGPPPHARGAPSAARYRGGVPGATPARAGSTGVEHRQHHRGRDHPRTRGEHRRFRECRLTALGPPPHARGAPSVSCGVVSRRDWFRPLLRNRTIGTKQSLHSHGVK